MKETLAQVFSREFYEIFKNTILRTRPVAVSKSLTFFYINVNFSVLIVSFQIVLK